VGSTREPRARPSEPHGPAVRETEQARARSSGGGRTRLAVDDRLCGALDPPAWRAQRGSVRAHSPQPGQRLVHLHHNPSHSKFVAGMFSEMTQVFCFQDTAVRFGTPVFANGTRVLKTIRFLDASGRYQDRPPRRWLRCTLKTAMCFENRPFWNTAGRSETALLSKRGHVSKTAGFSKHLLCFEITPVLKTEGRFEDAALSKRTRRYQSARVFKTRRCFENAAFS
jgi:hypothetical protein